MAMRAFLAMALSPTTAHAARLFTSAPVSSNQTMEVLNFHRPAGAGGWGGICTCPDGQTYAVGDNGDNCASLFCEGGTPGACSSSGAGEYGGYGVTCAQAPASLADSNLHRPAGAGEWGGPCTCPDGQTYAVGDNGDNCASLFCEGGIPGACSSSGAGAYGGYGVTCAQAPAPPAVAPASSAVKPAHGSEAEADAEAAPSELPEQNIGHKITVYNHCDKPLNYFRHFDFVPVPEACLNGNYCDSAELGTGNPAIMVGTFAEVGCTTLAEVTFAEDGQIWYDVSKIRGFNAPITMGRFTCMDKDCSNKHAYALCNDAPDAGRNDHAVGVTSETLEITFCPDGVVESNPTCCFQAAWAAGE